MCGKIFSDIVVVRKLCSLRKVEPRQGKFERKSVLECAYVQWRTLPWLKRGEIDKLCTANYLLGNADLFTEHLQNFRGRRIVRWSQQGCKEYGHDGFNEFNTVSRIVQHILIRVERRKMCEKVEKVVHHWPFSRDAIASQDKWLELERKKLISWVQRKSMRRSWLLLEKVNLL